MKKKKQQFTKGIRVKVKNENDNNYLHGVIEDVNNQNTENPTYVVKLDNEDSTRQVSLPDIEFADFGDFVTGGAKKKPKRKSKNKTMKKKKKVTKKKLILKKKKKYTQKKIR